MPSSVENIPSDAIQTAANRLGGIGVFADEDRNYPTASTLRLELATLDERLRSSGYTGGSLALEYLEQPRDGVEFLVYDAARFVDARSAENAWYTDYRNRWHARVVARVNDWITRLHDLKILIRGWLPEDMSIVDRPPTRMHEELMRKFNVPPASMPTFEVVQGSKKILRAQPKGLWIIGANGRVDLVTAKGS